MPIYRIKCEKCTTEKDVICSYEKVKVMCCEKCGNNVIIIPSKTAFFIEGYSYQNGYAGSDVSYDGTDKSW